MKPIRLNIVSVLASVLVVAMLVSCSQSDSPSESDPTSDSRMDWEQISKSDLDETEQKLYRRAEKARGNLAGTLMGRVKEAISNKGPTGAIGVCDLEASGLTQKVAEKHDVKIGRTSFRLRNPENNPPDWAKQFNLVKKRIEEQVILHNDSGRVAVFSPIRLGKKCATCHGPKDQLSDDVKDALAERYPEDEATGFKPGDLRGWFWAEVPNT